MLLSCVPFELPSPSVMLFVVFVMFAVVPLLRESVPVAENQLLSRKFKIPPESVLAPPKNVPVAAPPTFAVPPVWL